MKRIVSAEDTRQVAARTIKEIADVVGQTLGPGGNPIALQQQGSNPDGSPKTPVITKDGVTVAEHIVFRDPVKNTIAQSILQVAKNTVSQAGDGTTTSIVLADAMFRAGMRHIKQGANGIELYNQLKEVKDYIVQELNAQATPITPDQLIDVARIAANGDEEVAAKVAEAIQAVGEDGHVTIEDGVSRETILEKIEGAMYKQGWRKFGALGSLMVNDRSRNVCDMDNPAILLYAGEIKEALEVSGVLQKLWNIDDQGIPRGQVFPILFIAYDYSDDVKNHIMQMRVQGKMPIAALKAPFDGSPNARTQMLEDLSVLLGGHVAAKGIIDLKDIEDEHLGCAQKVVIGPEETVFYQGSGDETEILNRVEDLKTQLKTTAYDFDRDNIRFRIGKLVGGIAIIRAGGGSELEIKEKKDRIEDALCAAKVAIAEGILPGGGITLYKLAKRIEGRNLAETIMAEALQEPIKRIITNVGKESASILTRYDMLKSSEGVGYDARRNKFVIMMKAGIVDPLKVTKSAVENAVSIVGLLLTIGGAVVNDVESEDGKANPLVGMFG